MLALINVFVQDSVGVTKIQINSFSCIQCNSWKKKKKTNKRKKIKQKQTQTDQANKKQTQTKQKPLM